MKSNSTSFEKIILTKTEYLKSKINSNEVFFGGKMYDVKSAKFKNDNVELLVINDIDEDDIIEKIKNIVKKNNSSNNEIPNQLKVILTLNFLLPNEAYLNLSPSFLSNLFPPSTLNIPTHFLDILSPPPWKV